MRKLIVLIVLVPSVLFAQNKKDNAIIIHDTVSNKTINEVLFSAGYDLNRDDSDFIPSQNI